MQRYYKLLKEWCDRLIDLQITEIKDPHFYGGILCPSCAMIHGRIADSVYPFVLMYDKTKNTKYLDAAKKVIEWSEYNLLRKDGSIYNDKCSSWKGISVFSATSLGDALYYHGKCLDKETKQKWTEIFLRFADFTYEYFNLPTTQTNVNYYVTICAVMAFAYKFTGDEKYKNEGYRRYNLIKQSFTEEGLLFGEGRSKKIHPDCAYVDLGYNVEESLPALAVFGHLMEDEDVLRFVAEKFAIHIEFMLPDGGWDNSWGTRSNKWTYWGSRTSDGAQTGLCYLVQYGDIFSEAIERNFNMLEKCSKDGFLFGGHDYIEHGEEPCVHHSFCHAKSLAIMIDTNFEYKRKTALPRDEIKGVKTFESINVNLISIGDFRATITSNDAVDYFSLAPTGGTLSALWSKRTGMIFAASAPNYATAMTEPRNMQLSRINDNSVNCTLRIEKDGFLSQNDKNVNLKIAQKKDEIKVSVSGKLRDINLNGEIPFEMEYIFTERTLKITAMCEEDADIIIPIIAQDNDKISLIGNSVVISKPFADLKIDSNDGIFIVNEDLSYRDISLIGGFTTFPISAKLKKDLPFSFTISI